MTKIPLSRHLQKLLEYKKGQLDVQGGLYMDTCTKRYRKFLRQLFLTERDPEGDKIFKALEAKNLTLTALCAKKRGQEQLLEELLQIYDCQQCYYNCTLKGLDEASVMQHVRRIADADIKLHELQFRNAVGISGSSKNDLPRDPFWDILEEKWTYFNNQLDKLFNLFFSDYYKDDASSPFPLSEGDSNFTVRFKDALCKETAFFKAVKDNYSSCKLEQKSDSAYKNLYMHCRNNFINNFYLFDLPDVDGLLGFKNYNPPFKKDVYTLKDVAGYYCAMMGQPDIEDKIYQRIKKAFQKSEYMQQFKKTSSYEFQHISVPLAEYIYYKRKSHSRSPLEPPFIMHDRVISERYAPLVSALLSGDGDRISTYQSLKRFIECEFDDLFSTLNNTYQNHMLTFLVESIERIFAITCGHKFDMVYNNWDYVVGGTGENSQF